MQITKEQCLPRNTTCIYYGMPHSVVELLLLRLLKSVSERVVTTSGINNEIRQYADAFVDVAIMSFNLNFIIFIGF